MAEVVDEFEHEGFKCVIARVKQSGIGTVFARGGDSYNYHNGYIKVAESSDQVDSNIREEGISEGHDATYERFQEDIVEAELTFAGEFPEHFDGPEGYYLGFDTAHSWNRRNPKSQKLESVKERLKIVAEEAKKSSIKSKIEVSDDG